MPVANFVTVDDVNTGAFVLCLVQGNRREEKDNFSNHCRRSSNINVNSHPNGGAKYESGRLGDSGQTL